MQAGDQTGAAILVQTIFLKTDICVLSASLHEFS